MELMSRDALGFSSRRGNPMGEFAFPNWTGTVFPSYFIISTSFLTGTLIGFWFRAKIRPIKEFGRRYWASKFRNPAWLEPLNFRNHNLNIINVNNFNNNCIISRSETLNLISRNNYALLYDTELKIPLWCGFYLTKGQIKAARHYPRPCIFFIDKSLPKESQISSSQMQQKEYDKGHMAPHASVASCGVSNFEASLLSNIVLQHKVLNRGIWKRLEYLSRCYVIQDSSKNIEILTNNDKTSETLIPFISKKFQNRNKCLAISTGVLFNKKNNSLNYLNNINNNEKNIPIPDEMYMAFWDVHSNWHTAFILPNDETSNIVTGNNHYFIHKPKKNVKKRCILLIKNSKFNKKKKILKHKKDSSDKKLCEELNRFLVTFEELEERITASEKFITEKKKFNTSNNQLVNSFNELKRISKEKYSLKYESSRVELFPLQRRKRYYKIFISRLFRLQLLSIRSLKTLSQDSDNKFPH